MYSREERVSEPQEADRAYGFLYGRGDVDRDPGHQQTCDTCDHCAFAPDGVLLLYDGLTITAHEKRLSNLWGMTVLNIS